MTYEDRGLRALDYEPCRYGTSKLMFRGPAKSLEDDFIAFLGGTETYGKFVPSPFPELIEDALDISCVNLGCMQSGPDAYLNDPKVVEICNAARAVVIQVPHATNISNRFFSVHPRRNDRFLRASTIMQSIYHDVDFTDFTFVRHMLSACKAASTDRYELVVQEMHKAWLARMTQLIERINCKIIVFGLRGHHPISHAGGGVLGLEPLYVMPSMLESLDPLVFKTLWITPTEMAVKNSQIGMVYPLHEEKICEELMGPLAHQEVAATLNSIIGPLLQS